MPLREQLNADLREALRSGDETRKTTLRMLLSALRNAEIPPEPGDLPKDVGAFEDAAQQYEPSGPQRIELDEEAVQNVVRREVKQRRDSIDAYRKAGRPDLVAKEEAEIAILAPYLPPQMSRDDIVAAARAVIERVGARVPADKGKVMPALIAELRGRADGGEINAVVTELLTTAT